MSIENNPYKVGQRVAYKAAFLRSCGIYSRHHADLRGPIKAIKGAVCYVAWPDGVRPMGVLHVNLIRADRIHLEVTK